MKHKAQEHLDILECKVYENSDRCEHYEKYKCIKCSRVESLVNLQDLITCQLTVEEIDNLILCAKIVGVFKALNGESLEKSEIFISLQKKLRKQKEMWVSENE